MFDNLRLVRTDFLAEYRDNTDLFLRVGNANFAAAIRDGSAGVTQTQYPTPWMLYHSWRAQRINIDAQSAEIIRELMSGATPEPRHAPIVRKLEELGWCDDDQPPDLDEMVKRTQDFFLAIQNEFELRNFLDIVRDKKPRTVVEIGTARGGVFYCFCQLAARDATLVSIDLPGAPNCGGQTEVEREVFATFGPASQSIHFIPDDSHLPSSYDALQRILGDRKIDLLFIDGDHSYEGCMRDFEIYNGLVAADGLIVFHDICVFPDAWPGNAVGEVWRKLGPSHGGREIIDPDGVSHPELKPGERWRWGIGIIEAANLTHART
ncbi:MAG: class I SAM-dependent methyltransferase [Gammaproteobacteria bacterium]